MNNKIMRIKNVKAQLSETISAPQYVFIIGSKKMLYDSQVTIFSNYINNKHLLSLYLIKNLKAL